MSREREKKERKNGEKTMDNSNVLIVRTVGDGYRRSSGLSLLSKMRRGVGSESGFRVRRLETVNEELDSSRVGNSRNYMIDEFRQRMISKRKRDSSEDDEEDTVGEDDTAVVSSYDPQSDVRSLLRRRSMKKVCELERSLKESCRSRVSVFRDLSAYPRVGGGV